MYAIVFVFFLLFALYFVRGGIPTNEIHSDDIPYKLFASSLSFTLP